MGHHTNPVGAAREKVSMGSTYANLSREACLQFVRESASRIASSKVDTQEVVLTNHWFYLQGSR